MNLIKRNLGWLLMSQLATWGMSILVLLISPRKLGDNAFGKLTFASVFVSFFELLGQFGTGTFLMKTVAREESRLARYVFNTLALKVLMGAALAAVAVSLAASLGNSREMVLLIGVFAMGMYFNVLNNALVGGLQGVQSMGRPALWEIARSYFVGLAGLSVLLHGGSLLMYAFVINLGSVIPLIGNAVHLRSVLRVRPNIDIRLWREVLVGGFPFFVWSALLVVYGLIDIPLLQHFCGSDTVGWYGLAYRWVGMPAFFAASVATAFFPSLSADSIVDREAFARLANRALRIVILVTTPAAIGIALIAGPFLTLLYGNEFAQSVPLMRILALHIPIVGIDIVLGVVVVAADRQRAWTVVALVAALFNPLLNLAAIPLTVSAFGNGAIGAAAITVLTEFLVMVGALLLRPAGVFDRVTSKFFVRALVASLAMVPVVLALGQMPLAVQIAGGAITYGVVSMTLGTVTVSEIRQLGGARFARQPS
jgi:O-antigen/teichoic acid export membrane protein